jgi:antitoxin CcdA
LKSVQGNQVKSMQRNQARKRAVNLTLNEDLVSQAKGMTGNLSGVVEQLLADYVLKQNDARQVKRSDADAAAQGWNAFNEQSGSFADDHSTL